MSQNTSIVLSPSVRAEWRGRALLLTVTHPPLNLLSSHVRQGLAAGLTLGAEAERILIATSGKSGFSGADISEFGAIAQPDLPSLIDLVTASKAPVIALISGRTLGGGFELALASAARISAPGVRMGLPEIKLGLIPACDGIERVSRLAGVDMALDLCLSGRDVSADEALASGLIDAIAEGDLIEAALALPLAPRPLRQPDPEAGAKIEAWKAGPGRKLKGQEAPAEALALIAAAAADPSASLREASLAAFARLEQGRQSAALRHVFAAERKVKDLPFLPEGVTPQPISHVGIVGAGTMGSGIATAMLSAGLSVTLYDASEAGLERGRSLIEGNLHGAVKRGKLTPEGRDAALARLTLAPSLEALSSAELIVEAVYESMAVKLDVFAKLDAIAAPGAILASNTSFLDIDQMAAATSRPDRVLGMHFFSPAHVMRLLEVVRGAKTDAGVIATAMELGRRIGKIAVCVGNCHGFVGNRILLPRQQAAMELLLEGHTPWVIDRAMTNFGLPMGPFEMADLAGLDVGWDREASAGRTMEEVFCEAGRFGRKNGLGYYDYGSGRPEPSPEALKLIEAFRAKTGSTEAGTLSEAEILARLLGPMLEETGKIIDEGIVLRPSDIDVIWVHGFGWPAWRGGPAYYRDQQG